MKQPQTVPQLQASLAAWREEMDAAVCDWAERHAYTRDQLELAYVDLREMAADCLALAARWRSRLHLSIVRELDPQWSSVEEVADSLLAALTGVLVTREAAWVASAELALLAAGGSMHDTPLMPPRLA